MKEVIEFLKSKIDIDDKMIVACSGGSDSMGLLHLIMSNFQHKNIICAHVNHRVRKQSYKEYEYVKKFCEKHKIIFEGIELSGKIGKNFENEARNMRYDFFYYLKDKYHAKYIITAHHADDQIETILMRITRGSNLSGYSGIKFEDKDFLRPLLSVTKKDLTTYVKQNHIRYYEDYTNKLNYHTRNKYRHKIIPFLKKENPFVHTKYLDFSQELQDYDSFIKNYIIKKNLIKDNKVSVKELNEENDFIKRKVIEILIKNIQRNDYLDVSKKNVENMLKIINSSKSNSIIDLSNGYIGKKNYDVFEICKSCETEDYEVIFDTKYVDNMWKICSVELSNEKSNYVLRIDSNEITLPLIIRNRRRGDFIQLKNSGTKKIKDIFIDEKISKDEREVYPVVVDSKGNILWLPGLKKSKFDKEKNEKYDIILSSERKSK